MQAAYPYLIKAKRHFNLPKYKYADVTGSFPGSRQRAFMRLYAHFFHAKKNSSDGLRHKGTTNTIHAPGKQSRAEQKHNSRTTAVTAVLHGAGEVGKTKVNAQVAPAGILTRRVLTEATNLLGPFVAAVKGPLPAPESTQYP